MILCLCGCASSQTDSDEQSATSGVAPAAAWRFDFVDTENKSLGYLVMAFSDQPVDEPTCGYDYWKKMVVLDDKLDFDFGAEFQPAYTIFGPWLTIDLTASVCSIDHNMIGDISADGASGHFTLSHKIGGNNLGRFTAHPVSAPNTEVLPELSCSRRQIHSGNVVACGTGGCPQAGFAG